MIVKCNTQIIRGVKALFIIKLISEMLFINIISKFWGLAENKAYVFILLKVRYLDI